MSSSLGESRSSSLKTVLRMAERRLQDFPSKDAPSNTEYSSWDNSRRRPGSLSVGRENLT